jgi:drug/metabolite transporter (DMT)-like permease
LKKTIILMPMRYFTFIYRRFETLPIAIRAAWWMCLSAFAYAASIAIVHHLTHRLPVFEIALGRNVFALVFMLPWLYSVGLRAMRTSHFGMHAIRGLFSAANVWFLFGSLALAPVADVSAITFLMPIIAAILAVLFFGEKTSVWQWLATLVGFCGALIVIRPGLAGFNPGLLLALGSVLAGSTVAMMIKSLLKTDSSDTIAAWLFISHTVLGLIPAIVVWVKPNWQEVFWLILLGYLGTVIQRAFNRSMSMADATVVLPFNFTRLIWAALLGYMFFSEIPDLWTWLGGTIIFLASIWLTRISSKRQK